MDTLASSTMFALLLIISLIIVASSIVLVSHLIHNNCWFLLLGSESKSKWPSFWMWANYHHAQSLILLTNLSTISFATFCVFGAFASPIAVNQLYMVILCIITDAL
jgi:hypothetical protein